MSATPLFAWLRESRGAGIFLHPTALPGEFGIGTLDSSTTTFLDFLRSSGFRFWQICPLGPTGYGDSPYQCFSSFAGNPYLIDVLDLCSAGYVEQDALGPLLFLSTEMVDFGGLYRLKRPILRQAAEGFFKAKRRNEPYGPFDDFRRQHASWIEDFGYFQALKEHYEERPWWQWPAEHRDHSLAAGSPLRRDLRAEIDAQVFYQYVFFGQWARVRKEAAARGIGIIGDVPIFTAPDSSDTWSNPGLFQLDPDTSLPLAVAGCPPDYFSPDGQLWGNPVYAWEEHERTGFAWWMSRLRSVFSLHDIVRLDHFRGFEAYWSIPAGSRTARGGKWIKGPGLKFFEAVKKHFPRARLIAEDLGTLTPEVLELRDAAGLPGMSVLQFAFGDGPENFYLPHNHRPNSVVYSGTHDNDTSRGWYESAPESVKDHLRRYLRVSGSEAAWDLVRTAYRSVADLAIIPLPDLMNLGSDARFNTPGRAEGNWSWRFSERDLRELEKESSAYLRELGGLYGRLPAKPTAGGGKG